MGEGWKTTFFRERTLPMQRSIERRLREKGIECPTIELRVVYVIHHLEENARTIRAELEDADIFIPEFVSTDEKQRMARGPGFGGIDGYRIFKHSSFEEFTSPLADVVRRRNIPVGIVDSPLETTIGKTASDAAHARTDILSKKTLEEMTRGYRENDDKCWPAQRAREHYMADHLEDELVRMIIETPALQKNGKKIRAVMYLGMAHQPFSNLVRKQIKTASIVCPTVRESKSPEMEITEMHMRGEKPADALIHSTLIENQLIASWHTLRWAADIEKSKRYRFEAACAWAARLLTPFARDILESRVQIIPEPDAFNRDPAHARWLLLMMQRYESILMQAFNQEGLSYSDFVPKRVVPLETPEAILARRWKERAA